MPKAAAVMPFLAGAATALLLRALLDRQRAKRDNRDAGATAAGDDLSLFYGDRRTLTTVTERRRFLASAVYGALVRDAVVCCVDVVLVRRNRVRCNRRECLLVARSAEPVKGVWWWPGGRLLKGETFFDAAKRKVQQEVGISNVNCIQVLGVWNTFFPTSAWDNDESRGTQTVNAVVLAEVVPDPSNGDDGAGDDDDDNAPGRVRLDATSEAFRWIPLDAARAAAAGEDTYVVAALRRLAAWSPGYAAAAASPSG